MAIQVLMPALSPTMTEGKLAKWLKQEGDSVESGDVIAEIETDKATMELEAADEGVLGKILVQAGTEGVSVNAPIAVLLEDGEDSSAADAVAASAPQPQPASQAAQPEAAAPEARAPEAAAQPAAGPVAVPPPPEEEYTGTTVTMTVREALRDAMAEEIRRDEAVFLMGEEVAEYEVAYKVSQGLLAQFGP